MFIHNKNITCITQQFLCAKNDVLIGNPHKIKIQENQEK